MHIFHKWPKWSERRNQVWVGIDGREYNGQIQERTCEICGEYQWRKV